MPIQTVLPVVWDEACDPPMPRMTHTVFAVVFTVMTCISSRSTYRPEPVLPTPVLPLDWPTMLVTLARPKQFCGAVWLLAPEVPPIVDVSVVVVSAVGVWPRDSTGRSSAARVRNASLILFIFVVSFLPTNLYTCSYYETH